MIHREHALRSGALALALLATLGVPGARAQEADQLAEELIRMRSEVEDLHSRLATARERHLGRMGSLARERGDLEAEVNRERLVITGIEAELERNRQEAEAAGSDDESLTPAVLAGVDQARAYVSSALPFKIQERMAALDEIEAQVRSGALPATRAVNRLWAFYEDEMRLTRENGVYRQAITVQGASRLADVARLGMVMMFFRTGDGELGRVTSSDEGWAFEELADARDREQVSELFDSLEKQVRTGFFELPNTIDLSGGAG